MASTIQIGLPISRLTPTESLSKNDYLAVSINGDGELSTRRAEIYQIGEAISGDIYNYTINNLSTVTPDIAFLSAQISAIQERIPAQTYEEGNELADKLFVNSSIQTSTANFKGTYDVSTDLPSVDVKNNDYAFVTERDICCVISAYNRYKYSEPISSWQWEYKLNNSGFTAVQWSAINSGITSELVARIPNPDEYTLITTGNIDNKTLIFSDNKLSVGTILKSQITDLPEIPSVDTVNGKVSLNTLNIQTWTFHMTDGSTKNYNIVLSSSI